MCEKSNEEKADEKELATELKAVILFCNEQGKPIPEQVFTRIKRLESKEVRRKLRRIARRENKSVDRVRTLSDVRGELKEK